MPDLAAPHAAEEALGYIRVGLGFFIFKDVGFTRPRRPASIGSNQSSRRRTAVAASNCRVGDFVLLLVMAWSPPDAQTPGSFGFQHPETTLPRISTTSRTAPVNVALHT